MTPRKKPVPPESDDSDDTQELSIGNKNLNVKLSLHGRGIVLIYAIAIALLVGTCGWVAVQLINALKITREAVPAAVGIVTWMALAWVSASFSRWGL